MKMLIVCNWKMNPVSAKEAQKLLDATIATAKKAKKYEFVVAPTMLHLALAAGKKRVVTFAAQNARAGDVGAHTGDVSMKQVKSAGARSVIIGHAERRAEGETDSVINEKVLSALACGLSPIVCVGEKERTAQGEYLAVVRAQLERDLKGVTSSQMKKIVIAYEPVWAIGKEKPMSPRDMHEMAIFIRKTLNAISDAHDGAVLYGGSIDESTVGEMLTLGDVQGLLVGRASQTPQHITALGKALPKI